MSDVHGYKVIHKKYVQQRLECAAGPSKISSISCQNARQIQPETKASLKRHSHSQQDQFFLASTPMGELTEP